MRQPFAASMTFCWLRGRQARDWGFHVLVYLKSGLAQFAQCYSYASSHNPPTLLSWEFAQIIAQWFFPHPCLGFVLPRLTLKYETTGFLQDECAQVLLVSECRLADLSSSHSTLLSDQVFMSHSAAMPYCIRKPLCLPGPQPLCPSVLYPTCLTVGLRHAPIIQAMCPPVGLMRLGRPRQQVLLSSDQGSAFYHQSTCASELKG